MDFSTQLVILTIVCILQCQSNSHRLISVDEIKHKIATGGIENRITRFGYSYEQHEVTTQDGYILTLFRMKCERKCDNLVLVLGGMNSTPEVHLLCNESLGFVLNNRGYDVWFGNFRGTLKYSRHVKYSKLNPKFWEFSWEEMGDYDLPSMIDYILQINKNKPKLALVSYSLTTVAAMTMQATKVEYNDKISRHVALGPSLHEKYITSIALTSAYHFYDRIKHAYDTAGKNLPTPIFVKLVYYWTIFTCQIVSDDLCRLFFSFIFGYSPTFANGDNSDLLYSAITSGISLRTIVNLAQVKRHDFLGRYDFGPTENLRRYGNETPPVYDWSRITTPTSLFYGANDPIVNPLSLEMASRYLKSSSKVLMEGAMFTHLDFIFYSDRKQLKRVTDKILEHLQLNS